MHSLEVFVVEHSMTERGEPAGRDVRYATTKDAADELAAQPWGWYNGSGRVLPAKKILTIFETPFEVTNYNSEKETLKREIAKYKSDLEAAEKKLRSL